jgi:hypothetical protein
MVREGGEARIVSFSLDEADIITLMRQPWVMTGSDGGLVPMGQGVPHPRATALPAQAAAAVIEQQVIDLASAIRSRRRCPPLCSASPIAARSAPAWRPTWWSSTWRACDTATYQQPHQLAEGMVHVPSTAAWRSTANG